MLLAKFWLKHERTLFKGIATLGFVFMILVLSELTGMFENGLLLRFFKTVSPDFPIQDLPSYYYQALILVFWLFLFIVIHLKFFAGPKGNKSIKFGKISVISLILFIMFFFISPRPYIIDYEPLTQFKALFYEEDGIFEVLTAVFLFISFLAFLFSAKISLQKKLDWKIPFLQISLGLFCLIFCMEEISWGQRIFDFGTVEWAMKINSQNETNVHNICNKVLHTIYCLQFLQIIFNIFFSLALLYLAGLSGRIQVASLQGFLDLRKFYFLAIIMAIGTLLPNELNEELMALFFLIYSYDVLKFYRNFQSHQTA